MRIKVNTTQINYELTGPKDRPIVMMSHSLGSSLRMWDAQMRTLEPHFTVLRYDLRGHGASEADSGPYILEMLAEDAVSLLDTLGIEMVHWLGISIGGMIGQCVALSHGNRLKSLALCDTTSRIPVESQSIWQQRIDKVRRKGIQALLENTMERWFTPPFLRKKPPELLVIEKEFLATTPEGYLGCANAIRKLDYFDRLSEIGLPTLIIVGEDDLAAPVAASKAMHEQIPNSKLIVIPSASHFSNVEQPSAFNAALMEFYEWIEQKGDRAGAHPGALSK